MAPITNARAIYNEIPKDLPDPKTTVILDTSQQIDLENVPVPTGGVLVKTLYLSVDPYMRGRMRDPSRKSYSAPYTLGQPVDGRGVGVVLRSESNIPVGAYVYATFQYQEYVIFPDASILRVLDNKHNLPLSTYVGVIGMPGQTAYFAWKEFAHPKPGETVFVSTGAGPVGSFVIQLAKQDGLQVIASAGTDTKVEFIKSIGADIAFNYKTTNTLDVLTEAGGIDIYWDNVGGETLDAALEAAHLEARFIECGMISNYGTNRYGNKNLFQVIGKSISMHGFIVWRLEHKYGKEFYEVVPELVASGKIKYKEEIYNGLGSFGQALRDLMTGGNEGKAVIKVADP